ncbi:MAG: FGGY-family carbohydrate kinase [Spirochaetaceae bacterium]|nr:FGGY-family carbohydrate kinase [Spirochaetaceae bacterium]RKX96953.1 MAG: hypothetical protein DRZ90_07780 [Spirochaetota bacterium]
MLFFGIDSGTQGIRGLITDERGSIVADGSSRFTVLNAAVIEKHYEQSAMVWLDSLVEVIGQCITGLNQKGFKAEDITGIGIDGTSGTVIPIDSSFKPLGNALMYNDGRSDLEMVRVQKAGEDLSSKLGYRFKPSFSLPKILWIKENQPAIFEKTRYFVHQSDYIIGFLTGNYQSSDYTNALKTGYDLIDDCWPDFIESDLGIPLDRLPEVVSPGSIVGTVSKTASRLTGLSAFTRVSAGATDGIASALASGIKKPGDYNTTIGTTLVIKGLTDSIISDKQGRIYSHRHPDGYWIPGGASNTGGICLKHHFPDRDFKEMDLQVNLREPSGLITYPLTGKGERFPFQKPDAEGFTEGNIRDDVQLYTALLEGVAFTERLSYSVMENLGCEKADSIYTAGGAAKSDVWLQIRANILQRRLIVPKVVEAAMGSAILAASTIAFNGTSEAVAAMVGMEKEILPDSAAADKYEESYEGFLAGCRERGYTDGSAVV